MKSSPYFLVSLFSALITSGNSQSPVAPTIPEATRTPVPGSPGGPVVQAAQVAVIIRSLQADGNIAGLIGFFPSGDSVEAHGDIAGLEPNRRYRVVVDRPVAAAEKKAEQQQPAPEASNAAASIPVQPTTEASHTEVPADKSTRELGILSSDAKGFIHINTLLRKATLKDGPTTILNGTVSVWREPAGTSESVQVASGVIEVVRKPPILPATEED